MADGLVLLLCLVLLLALIAVGLRFTAAIVHGCSHLAAGCAGLLFLLFLALTCAVCAQ